MYKIIIVFVFLLCSCFATTQEVEEPFYTNAAVDACYEYCADIFKLEPRNANTYFCECIFGIRSGEIVVISKGGTVYK